VLIDAGVVATHRGSRIRRLTVTVDRVPTAAATSGEAGGGGQRGIGGVGHGFSFRFGPFGAGEVKCRNPCDANKAVAEDAASPDDEKREWGMNARGEGASL